MPHQEAVAITINSIHRQNYVLASRNATVEWSKSLQQTGTARWKMAGVDGDWVPLVGQAFGIYDTSVPGWGDPWQLGLIFAGSIDSVTPEKPAAPVQPDWLEIEVTGSSREQTLQRRLIRPFGFGYRYSRYKGMTAGAIAQAVLTDFADGENLVITPANFDDGPTIPFVAWNHQSVAEALTQLADYAEMHWWVAPDSQVYFKEREAVPAPWGIVDGDNKCQRLSVRESRENLNNAVYYRTTFASFADDPLPEFKNPSETVIVTTPGQTFFQTEMQIQEAIDIATEIPGVEGLTPQEIEQSDGTEALFWYIPGDDGFSLTTGKTLPLGAQITFHYNRLGGDVIPVEDATAISERAAIEIVGSGRYELAVANTAYTSRAAAEQRASMIIQQRRNTAMVIDGETTRKGLDVGQWLVVSTSNPPINDTFLVTSVSARAVLGTPKISFSFTGVNGSKLPNGWDFFTGLGDAGFGGGFGSGFQGAGMAGAGGGGGSGRSLLVDLWREVPMGTIDGTNTVFYLTHTVKPPWSLELKLNQNTQYPKNNAVVRSGDIPGYQYLIEGNKITYTIAPQPGDVHDASYWRGEAGVGDYPGAILAEPSLVGYYRLEETSGTVVFDSKGTNHGTLVSPSDVELGLESVEGLGSCYEFGGVNGYVSIATLIGAGDYSIEFWFQTSGIPSGISNPLAPAESGFGLVNSTNGGDDDWGLALARVSGKTLVTAQTGSNFVGTFFGLTSNPAIDLSDGHWHYVVLTHVRSTGVSKLYVDGVLQDSDVLDTGPQNATPTTRFASITFLGGGFLPGKLDEIALYSDALSEAQIAAHLATLGPDWAGRR